MASSGRGAKGVVIGALLEDAETQRRKDATTQRKGTQPGDYGYARGSVSGDLGCMMPYERLKAWHASHALVLAIYKETGSWPVEERYGLISQARRAVVSVTDNLAEGSARLGGKELRRFADIALGSLAELHTRIARDLGFCSQEDWTRLDELRNQAGKLVYGLARAVGKRKPDP